MTKKPTVNSPHAKALEQPQHRPRVIPDKKREAKNEPIPDYDRGCRDPLRWLNSRDGI